MALSSYSHLMKQVESLRSENTHLRRELLDNSSHLSKLENDASSMKDTLSHLQSTMDGDDGDLVECGGEEEGAAEMGEELAGEGAYSQNAVTSTGENSLCEANDDSYEDDDGRGSWGEKVASAVPSPSNSALTGADNRAIYTLMQELDQERNSLMKEIETEEKHRKWFYHQLELITKKLEKLPLTESYNLQTDMARRQLEYEAQQVRGAMTEKLGSTEQSSQRQEARLQRVRNIEREMYQLQQHQQQQHHQQQQRRMAPCDVSRRDVGTSTTLSRSMFLAIPGQESAGYTCDRVVNKGTDGRPRVTVAAQTADVTLAQQQQQQQQHAADSHMASGLAAGMPLNAAVSSAMYHGAWPIHKDSGLRSSFGGDLGSVMSFTSTNTNSSGHSSLSSSSKQQPQPLGTKVEMVYSLLSMLGTHDKDDMSRTLLAMSSSQDSCIAMRQSGCLPLLIQLLHGSDKDSGLLGNTRGSSAARARASLALHNIVHSNPDDKRGRREARTLRLLEQIRAHCDQQRGESTEDEEEEGAGAKSADIDHHPGPAIAALMKLSFDEDYRHAICTLGGLQAIAELLEVDHMVHGNTTEQYSVTVRRYACMALTNLTFGDGKNKALLCSMRPAMEALVAQLRSPNEDLCQGAASVLRNLSWRADLASKKTLREVGAVSTLMEAAMNVKKETTLKSILSALWNLSSHCSENKAEICAVRGALEFLVGLLTYKSQGKTHAIVENGGGILRNVSSQVAVREDYRRILRKKGCLQTLLTQLRSPSLTIVSNACGTLWNLSARCPEDQQLLREMGAVGMLRNLVHSKHRMIAMGSSAALRNLLSSAEPGKGLECERGPSSNRPTLSARKQRALEEELDHNLAETCENVESPRDSPTDTHKSDGDGRRFVYPYEASQTRSEDDPRRALHRRQVVTRCGSSDAVEGRIRSPQRVPRASSQDSVTSVHSDISHDRARVHSMLAKSSHLLHRRQGGSLERKKEASGMHRVGSDNSCSVDKGPGQTSRIVQYMQEVAMLAGVDHDSSGQANLNKSHSSGSMSGGGGGGYSYQTHTYPGMHGTQRVLYEHLAKNGAHGVNLGYDRDADSDGSEEPVNYSLKYQDTNPNMYPEPSILGVGVNASTVQNSAYANRTQVSSAGAVRMPGSHPGQLRGPPSVKINNYVMPNGGANGMQPRHMPNMVHNRFPAPHPYPGHPPVQQQQIRQQQQQQHRNQQHHVALQAHQPRHRNIGSHQPVSAQFSAYAETDLDTFDDQPTDFSLRYSEEHTDEQEQEQPVNYSMRYSNKPDPHCVECKYEEARRANDPLDQSANDDQVLTFCTEGTPFLSNAPSLTDLSGKRDKERREKGDDDEKGDENDDDDDEDGGDEIHNYSAQYGESEHTAGSSCDRHTGSTVCPNASQSPTSNAGQTANSVPRSFHSGEDDSIPADQVKTYCEEGTPVCFSRVSSLSSLHSSEARDHQDPGRPVMLQSIEEKTDAMNTSVIENKNAAMKTALVDRDQRRNRADVEKEPKTVTFDENHQVEETPLMFSRCSSLGSLSSFDSQSVHSSVVSEYSRRASEVVSPSELPDSPSETMPPSPTRVQSPPVKSFKPVTPARANERQASTQEENNGWPAGRAANASTDRTAQLVEMFRQCTLDSNKQDAVSVMSGKSEVPVVYADEGPPPVHSFLSETSSLSALTVETEAAGNSGTVSDKPVADANASAAGLSAAAPQPKDDETDSADVTLCENKPEAKDIDDKDSSMSEVSEGEEEILAQCIQKAMPLPSASNRKMRKSSSDNAIKKKSGLPKPEASSTPSKSRLPTKLPTASSTPNPKTSKPGPSKISKLAKPGETGSKSMSPTAGAKQVNNSAKPPRPAPKTSQSQQHRQVVAHSAPRDEDFAPDTLKTFATEGTPLNFSAATSLSDLSVMTSSEPSAGVKASPPTHKSPPSADDCRSDNSSVCEESEQQLLTEMIQSAMPKSRTARRLDLHKAAQGADRKPAPKQPARPGATTKREETRRAGPPVQPKVCLPSATADTVKTYATEGTPSNFSAATSLSDLTVDSVEDFRDRTGKLSNPRSPCKSSASQQSAAQGQNAAGMTAMACDDGVFPSGALDSPHVYGMEGTPITFSRNDSLSSLDMLDDKEEVKQPQGRAHSDRSNPSHTGHLPPYLHVSERHVVGQSSEEGSVISDKHPRPSGKDEMKRFAVEDTPVSFSRNSSLSSLASGGRAKEPQPEDEPRISRTSSFSSNSTESASFDPTPSEQALLDQCISAAMPKRRPSRGEDRLRRQSRSAKDGGKSESRALQELRADLQSGAYQNSALETGAVSDDASLGETLPLDLSVRGEKGQRQKLMTRSCSDALDVESDGDGGRMSRFSSWRRHRQMSSDEMKGRGGQRTFLGGRSQSQDGDNFLKMQKNISNKITQSADTNSNSSSNSSSASTSRSGQPFLASSPGSCSTSVIQVLAPSPDNRLLEQAESEGQAHRGREAVLMREGSLVTSFTDSSSSAEKADSEKSVCDDHSTSRDGMERVGRRHGTAHEGSVDRLCATAQSLSTGPPRSGFSPHYPQEDRDPNQSQLEVTLCAGQAELSSLEHDDDDGSVAGPDETIHYEDGLEEKLCYDAHSSSFDQEDGGCESGHASFEQEITPEDERLLQENASLIVSEIVTKRDMTGSAFDEDMFIENETISLVSNDYTSDTNSEVSVSWSVSSDKVSERSCSTVSQAETVGSGGAKIVKPTDKKAGAKKGDDEEDNKAVRGRRKPLYSNRSSTSSVKSVGSAAKTESATPARSRPNSGGTGMGPGNVRSSAGANRSSAPPKKTPPKAQTSQTKSNLPGPKASPHSAQKPGTNTNNNNKGISPRSNLSKTAAGQRPGSGSGIPRSPARPGNTPPSKLPSAVSRRQDGSVERPKPPAKQATFVKDSPSASKDGKNSANPGSNNNNVRLRTRSASRNRSQSDKRNSGGLVANKRNSTGSPPEAWSKALDSFNFIVDKPGDNSLSQPYKQIQMQKNAKDGPPALKRSTITNGNKQQRPSNIARPQASGTPPKSGVVGKTTPGSNAGSKLGSAGTSPNTKSNLPSRNNLNKSGSVSSLRKAASGSSLTKASSGSSLNKGTPSSTVKKPGVTGPRGEVKKSESSASLRRGSDGSRPSTPVGRRPSNPLPATKKTELVGVTTDDAKPAIATKKQVASKVASTWKREVSMEEALPAVMTAPRPKPSKSSSLPAYTKGKQPWSSQAWGRKSSSTQSNSTSSGEEQSASSSTEGIPRSSTYDKFPAHSGLPRHPEIQRQSAVDQSRYSHQNAIDHPRIPSSDDRVHFDDCTSPSGSAGQDFSGGAVYEVCDPSSEDCEASESQISDCMNLDEAYIHDESETGTADEGAMTCSADSLEEAPQMEDSLSVPTSIIDSSTWRRKSRPSKDGEVSLQLPNADETCRSMCSFVSLNESQNESFARPADVSVWQKPGNDSMLSEASFVSNASITGKKSKSKKSVAKSIKSFLSGPKFFGSKQAKEQARLKELNEKAEKSFNDKADKSVSKADKSVSKKPAEAPKVSTVSTGTTTLAKTITIPTSKPSPAAVVAPFNYSPPSAAQITVTTTSAPPTITSTLIISKDAPTSRETTINDAPQKAPPITKHMTKTEMLLARRRQSYLNSYRTEDESAGEEDGSNKRGCMVTTV